MTENSHIEAENQTLRNFAAKLVASLGDALPPFIELIVHDLALLPQSVVVVTGNVSGRRPGDSATSLLLEQIASPERDRIIGFTTRLANGRELRSSTLVMRNSTGDPVVAICVNLDLSAWHEMRGLVDAVFGAFDVSRDSEVIAIAGAQAVKEAHIDAPAAHTSDSFLHDIDELTSMMLDSVIAEVGLPVAQMKKRHKVQVVAILKERGFFLRRDGVNLAAAALNVSRFTVYNYLQELGTEEVAKE